MRRHILFDLDGTLIDSAESILTGMATVLAEAGITPRLPLERSLIGPPLRSTLARLTGEQDPERIAALAGRFTQWYDATGFRGSGVYPGIDALLPALRQRGHTLHIVTNKRLAPTLLILDWLGWRQHFALIDTQDRLPEQPLEGKDAVIARLLSEAGITAQQAVYVGDRLDDHVAAARNSLPCVIVAWGYGAGDALPAGTVGAQTTLQLAQQIAAA
jgi:phosphoglycolate phosphatase